MCQYTHSSTRQRMNKIYIDFIRSPYYTSTSTRPTSRHQICQTAKYYKPTKIRLQVHQMGDNLRRQCVSRFHRQGQKEQKLKKSPKSSGVVIHLLAQSCERMLHNALRIKVLIAFWSVRLHFFYLLAASGVNDSYASAEINQCTDSKNRNGFEKLIIIFNRQNC